MSTNKAEIIYEMHKHIPEIYDQIEDETHDISFILDLIKDKNIKRILEPFCGNGRIMLPLAEAGYEVWGMDLSINMLNHLKKKLENRGEDIRTKIKLIHSDILKDSWPEKFDMIILGCNCMFELPTPEMQQRVLKKAYASLNRDGLLFIDNDNMEGELPEDWCEIGIEKSIFPNGICEHGIEFKGAYKTLEVDRSNRIWRAKRRVDIKYPDGKQESKSFLQQKHPVSAFEIKDWLQDIGFNIIKIWADIENKQEFHQGADRATFVAVKK